MRERDKFLDVFWWRHDDGSCCAQHSSSEELKERKMRSKGSHENDLQCKGHSALEKSVDGVGGVFESRKLIDC